MSGAHTLTGSGWVVRHAFFEMDAGRQLCNCSAGRESAEFVSAFGEFCLTEYIGLYNLNQQAMLTRPATESRFALCISAIK